MTSSINPNNIDGTYPIAGQDNDSQGFRDNFTQIKNNLTFAKSEIEELQAKAIFKSALLSAPTLDNSMAYSQLVEPQIIRAVETKNNLGTLSGAVTVNWGDGHFQYFTASGAVVLTFEGWPDNNQYAKLRLQIETGGADRTITFPAEVSVNLANIQGSTGQDVVLPANGTYVFELTTYDSATTVAIQDLMRNYDTGSLEITGTIINSGYQWANSHPSFGNLVTGNTFTVSSSVSRVILQPSAGFNSLFIRLPANVNAKSIRISSTANITAVSVSGATGTVIAPAGNITLTQGEPIEYFYLTSTGTWYRS